MLCAKHHHFEGACCPARTGTFCLSLLGRIVLDILGAGRLWALSLSEESLQASKRAVLQRTLSFVSLVCLTAVALFASTVILLPQQPTETLHCVSDLGVWLLFFNIYYLLSLCKSHKAEGVGWFGYLGKVMPNSLHLFLFFSFISLLTVKRNKPDFLHTFVLCFPKGEGNTQWHRFIMKF